MFGCPMLVFTGVLTKAEICRKKIGRHWYVCSHGILPGLISYNPWIFFYGLRSHEIHHHLFTTIWELFPSIEPCKSKSNYWHSYHEIIGLYKACTNPNFFLTETCTLTMGSIFQQWWTWQFWLFNFPTIVDMAILAIFER